MSLPDTVAEAPADVQRVGGAATRLVIAGLLAVAGVVHLVMVPGHAGEWLAEGIGFAVVGWVQLAQAAAVTVRCRRWVLRCTVAVNLAAIGLWVVSRTSGFPVGPHAHHAETVAFIDGFTVAVEGAAALLALALLVHRRHAGDAWRGRPGFAAVAALAAVAITTAVLTSPSARTHAHDAHDGHGDAVADDGHAHGDAATSPAVAGDTAATATDGHDHSEVATGTGATSDTSADDKGFSLLMNGHQHTQAPEPMDAATTALLAHQLARTAELVAKYPTVADAEADGYHRSGPFSPGLGAHYGRGTTIGGDGVIDDSNVLAPMLIYDGTDPGSRLVGFMYNAFGTSTAPEGFAGPNDVWHYHTNVCIVIRPDGSIDAPLGADAENIDKALCDKYNGFVIDNTGYMLHVWTVPGWENPLGVFHETHPGITCPDGTYYTKDLAEIGTALTTCRT